MKFSKSLVTEFSKSLVVLGSNLPEPAMRKIRVIPHHHSPPKLCKAFIEKKFVQIVVTHTGSAANFAAKRVRPPIEVRLRRRRKNYL